MSEEFDYVVARPWDDEDPNYLAIYTFGSQIQRGTIEEAKDFLNYVQRQGNKDEKYSIYKVNFEKIDT